MVMLESLLDNLKLENGLVVAIAQDYRTGEVLMCAYMNPEAVEETVKTGIAHYWSRSRKKLWKKGESSGHTQKVHEILVDCDADALLLKVEQVGGACHMGYRSCFYRRADGEITGEKLFNPDKVYKTSAKPQS
ncbi:MAG: Phosphoribosyl-AMP cyclohydrolase [Candidatus Argoarchaeum ethanivorans]|uniref:Phosphoribosyl-AMP cyclohydrolase n=1 Tax=Candidatus Argoarchaeum ethanivorans TaxID=2608793 RepID=A0A812A1Z5_9EURY|nr:MAG: Phosphoribosyl-AMP cyclohydrolase [Candidatus Argoarchaeum ethanivorans]